jgi:hypothetical protein
VILPVGALIEVYPGKESENHVLVDIHTARSIVLGSGKAILLRKVKVLDAIVESLFPVKPLTEQDGGVLGIHNRIDKRNIGESPDPGEVMICPPETGDTHIMVVSLLVNIPLGVLLHALYHDVAATGEGPGPAALTGSVEQTGLEECCGGTGGDQVVIYTVTGIANVVHGRHPGVDHAVGVHLDLVLVGEVCLGRERVYRFPREEFLARSESEY